ncbi:MAG: DNA-binding protein [Verrucomicrobia bacterium]|nr:MAG: DNA-binding protein [Verrucomicrobiota bacterium]PYJ33960.1 MAG: DNA-binding protein [Verrucomicrobiota bacterium]HTD84940.1 ORF6N domain-containing protein [Candidatus Binatia bacterium]
MIKEIIPVERLPQSIRWIRGQKVLLDSDLAALYGVTTGNLNKAVKRNAQRFPSDFTFRLSEKEVQNLRFQFGISRWGGRRALPYAFTEQGVAMLSSVLNSERAIRVNIAIMRAFVKLRQTLETNRELAQKFSELEQRVGKHDEEIDAILEAIRQLMAPPDRPRREIGFHVREKAPRYPARKRA